MQVAFDVGIDGGIGFVDGGIAGAVPFRLDVHLVEIHQSLELDGPFPVPADACTEPIDGEAGIGHCQPGIDAL